MGVSEHEESAVTWVKQYLKQKYNKPGNVYLGVVSRLDRMVTGVLLFARTSKAAKRLNEQFRERTTHKMYSAIVEGSGHLAEGVLSDWIAKDEKNHRMITTSHRTAGAQQAKLRLTEVETASSRYFVRIELITGRKHQIRVQLASRKLPILGDRKYGSRQRFPAGIALHAAELLIQHPVSREYLHIRSLEPEYWRSFR